MEKRNKKIDSDTPVLRIVEQLKNKALSVKDIPNISRPSVMGYLSFEGWSHPQIAELFNCCEKTVQRGLRAFEDSNRVTSDEDLVKRKVGHFLAAADNHIGALLRISRSPEASNPDKIAAENSAWKIRTDVITKLQSLGYLPVQPKQINGNFNHQITDIPDQSPASLRALIEKTEKNGLEAGVLDKKTGKRLEAIKIKIQQFEMVREISELTREMEQKGDENEESK